MMVRAPRTKACVSVSNELWQFEMGTVRHPSTVPNVRFHRRSGNQGIPDGTRPRVGMQRALSGPMAVAKPWTSPRTVSTETGGIANPLRDWQMGVMSKYSCRQVRATAMAGRNPSAVVFGVDLFPGSKGAGGQIVRERAGGHSAQVRRRQPRPLWISVQEYGFRGAILRAGK